MNKQDIERFIKNKKVVENAKKYWWAVLVSILILIYIVGFAFRGSSESIADSQKSTAIGDEVSVSYIAHPKGDEKTYTSAFLMDHVKPSQTSAFVNSLNLKDNPTQDIPEIVKMLRFSEISDQTLFGVEDYWQSPAEVLIKHEGDNEDWTNTVVSAISSYKPLSKCYVLALESHLTSFCYLGNGQYNWIDQYETSYTRTFYEIDTEQEKEAKIKEVYLMYSKRYRTRAGEDLKILFAYNDKDFVEFANNQEFFDWAVGLYS